MRYATWHSPFAACRALFLLTFGGLSCVGASGVAAQTAAYRTLGASEARSADVFPSISHVLELRGGGVLVSENGGAWIVLLDPSLGSGIEVADHGKVPPYSNWRGLIRWQGDSTLVINPLGPRRSISVIDGFGIQRRTIVVRPGPTLSCLVGGSGNPALVSVSRIVCQLPPSSQGNADADSGAWAAPVVPDSSALVRVDLQGWTMDTITFIRSPAPRMVIAGDGSGYFMLAPVIHPLPLVDEWALLPDGTLAIVRGSDYRIDFLRPSGERQSSPPLEYTPVRLSRAAKVALIDSVTRALQALRVTHPAATGRAWVPEPWPVDRSRIRGITIVMPGVARDPAGLALLPGREPAPLMVSIPDELPDAVPPFRPGGVRVDLDGHLWIRTTQATEGGIIHDVADRSGARVARVLLPPDRSIVGFGTSGVLFVAVKEASGVRLERARFVVER